MEAMQNYIWILVLIFVCGYMYGFGKALLVSAAPYMIPVTILIFIWELNIPRNIFLWIFYISPFSAALPLIL